VGIGFELREASELLIEVGKELADKGLVSGRSGNISARLLNGNVLISATLTMLGRLTPDDLIEIDYNGEAINGPGAPSSEKLMHLEVYRSRADVGSIVHTHSRYASAFAYLMKKLRSINYEYDFVLGDMAIAKYVQPGTLEFAVSARDALGDRRAALLQRHGAIAVGVDPLEALAVAELIEDAAKINYLIETLGDRARTAQ
jgi:L-ribulose-5-phosphate 4-epimerase